MTVSVVAPMTVDTSEPSPDDEVDLRLLKRWREGELSAGDELTMRHFESIYRFFCTKIAEDVDDLVQRTFVALLEAHRGGREIRSVRGWLFGTARNLLYERWRTRRDFDPGTSTLAELGPSASSVLAVVAEQRMLAAAVRRIPLDHQIILELHYWENMSGSEIAACLGEPEGTIRSRLRRARRELEDALAEVAETPDLLASTLGDLERWIASLRHQVPRRGRSRPRRGG